MTEWKMINGDALRALLEEHNWQVPELAIKLGVSRGAIFKRMRNCGLKRPAHIKRKCHQTAKTHCPRGHEYSGNNVYVNPSTGARFCRTCGAEKALAKYHLNKERGTLNRRKDRYIPPPMQFVEFNGELPRGTYE